jgi:hypothetical protein
LPKHKHARPLHLTKRYYGQLVTAIGPGAKPVQASTGSEDVRLALHAASIPITTIASTSLTMDCPAQSPTPSRRPRTLA